MADEIVSLQCKEHSGMVVWIKVGCGLLGILCALFSYSAFLQIPALRDELKAIASAQDKRIALLEADMDRIKILIAKEHTEIP